MTFLHYPGGKARLAPRIIALMAPHRVYLEAYSGTASVLFAKPRAPFEVINDIDRVLVTTLRVVRDQPRELAHALALTPYARDEYADATVGEDLDDLELARRVCVRLGQGWARHGLAPNAAASGWRISVRRGTADATTWATMPDRVMRHFERLAGVHIENLPALDLIDRYGRESDAVIYLDPPYLGSSRGSREVRYDSLYRHEMRRVDQHRELAAAIAGLPVLLSGYHSPLYDELYGDWHRAEYNATANHNGGGGDDLDTRRVEVVWSNRPLHVQGSLELEGLEVLA